MPQERSARHSFERNQLYSSLFLNSNKSVNEYCSIYDPSSYDPFKGKVPIGWRDETPNAKNISFYSLKNFTK